MFNKADFDKLDYLFSYQDNNLYYFQQISKVHLLSRKSISIGNSVEFHESNREIVIKELPDALYRKDKDILYFKKLSSITGIFKGIDSLYREATEGETEGFLKNAFIKLENEFSASHVKSANRKRIAIAVDTMKNCSERKKTVILDSIKAYCPSLVMADNKFKITSETDLKMILYGIGQRFYTTPDGEEKRIANSIIKLE